MPAGKMEDFIIPVVMTDIFVEIVSGKKRSDLGENVFPCVHWSFKPKLPIESQNQFKSFRPPNWLKPLSINTFKELKYKTLGR
jgi:hypothetical protein